MYKSGGGGKPQFFRRGEGLQYSIQYILWTTTVHTTAGERIRVCVVFSPICRPLQYTQQQHIADPDENKAEKRT